jgi:hypothetical protein
VVLSAVLRRTSLSCGPPKIGNRLAKNRVKLCIIDNDTEFTQHAMFHRNSTTRSRSAHVCNTHAPRQRCLPFFSLSRAQVTPLDRVSCIIARATRSCRLLTRRECYKTTIMISWSLNRLYVISDQRAPSSGHFK